MLWHLETNVREAAITEILQHSGAGGTERLHQLDPEAVCGEPRNVAPSPVLFVCAPGSRGHGRGSLYGAAVQIEKMLEIVAVMMSRPGFEAGPGT
jgi:hypothetical protein